MNLFQRSALTGEQWNEEDIAYHSKWRAASGYRSGKWHVGKNYPQPEDLEGPKGKLLLFKTYESAQKRADHLNSQLNSKK